MGRVLLEGVTKAYAPDVVALDDVSLEVGDGEFLAMVGPSGCGKSTALRLIAGLEQATRGEVWIGQRRVTNLLPRDRDVAMVFQGTGTFPHLTVAGNMGFGLKLRRHPRAEVRRRVAEVAEMLGLDGLLDRKPAQLSGGQRQRVAIGRAMLREPQAFLMDEPLSSLDARLRVQMRGELSRLHRRLGTTTLYVTHDQAEAMTLGDRVAVLNEGSLQQVDTPETLYRRPASVFVAAFLGSPQMNLLRATIDAESLVVAGVRVARPRCAELDGMAGCEVIVGIRPADLTMADAQGPGGRSQLEVQVDTVEFLGSEVHALCGLDSHPVVNDALRLVGRGAGPPTEGGGSGMMLSALLEAGPRVRPGSQVGLVLDPRRLHVFDLTGRALHHPE